MDAHKLVLTGIYTDGQASIDERIKNVVNNTGWDLKVADKIRGEPPPTHDELLTLRLFDPMRQFIGKKSDAAANDNRR